MIHVQRNIGANPSWGSSWPNGTVFIFERRKEEEMKHNFDKHLRGQFMDRTPVICVEWRLPVPLLNLQDSEQVWEETDGTFPVDTTGTKHNE